MAAAYSLHPPSDLAARKPKWRRVDPSALHRISRRGYALSEPYFAKSGANRFDAPAGQYGVCYVARKVSVCFAETVIRSPTSNQTAWPPGRMLIDEAAVRERVVLSFQSAPQLLLIDFTGDSQLLMGADATVSSAADYALPQAWSLALHEAFPKADGILYMSRHLNNQRAIAVFERARFKLQVDSSTSLVSHPSFSAICRRFRIALV